MDLGERKQHLLSAAIEVYIHTGEPVGSKLLAERLGRMGHTVSSATIRNEMADLAALGYLEQPHTSAGRIPTGKAFRLYIDRLMQRISLSEEEKRSIRAMLAPVADDPEKLLGEATGALAQVTGCAALSASPRSAGSAVHRVDIMRVSARTVALLLITDSGLLRNRVCRFDRPVDDRLLDGLRTVLNTRFAGCALCDIGIAEVQSVLIDLGAGALLCAPALTAFHDLVRESAEAEVRCAGQLNLLRHPDYGPEDSRMLLGLLAHQGELMRILSPQASGLQVVLGSESPRPELSSSSLIVTHYSPDGKGVGSLGLIGPMRMDYAYAIPRLEYITQLVSHQLAGLFDAGDISVNMMKEG